MTKATPCEVLIAPMHGHEDVPPIAITIKTSASTQIRVEVAAADFALALAGRLVQGRITRGGIDGG